MSDRWVPVVLAVLGLIGGGSAVVERSGFNSEVEMVRATLNSRVASLPDKILEAYERGLEAGRDACPEGGMR